MTLSNLYTIFMNWPRLFGLCDFHRVLFALFAVLFVVGIPASASAECAIDSVYFDQSGGYQSDGVPFFSGYQSDSSHRIVHILTNNDPNCKDKKVYVAIFAKNANQDGGPDPALKQVNGSIGYPVEKTGEIAGQPTYGLSISYYSGEEGCYDYTPKALKEVLAQTTKYTKADFQYLAENEKTKGLYGFLFDDEQYKRDLSDPTFANIPVVIGSVDSYDYYISPSNIWTTKSIVYKKFDKSVDCAYYARARLDSPVNVTLESDAQGKPVARFDSAIDVGVGLGNKVNYLGYMCKPPEKVYEMNSCDSDEEWEPRIAGASVAGTIDTGDPCTPNGVQTPGCYELLAPIPGLAGIDNTINFLGTDGGERFALEQFFIAAINVIVGATSVAAVLALMYYGYAMMSARSAGNIPNLSKYKARLWSVFLGLGIILGSYVILNTINPELLNIAPNLSVVSFDGDADGEVSKYADTSTYFKSVNFHCPGQGGLNEISKIALSADGKITYKLAQKGTPGPNGTIYSDCSGFAAKLYQCAGVPFPASSAFTGHIFKGAEVITSSSAITATSVNGKQLRPGDMLGWTAGGGEKQGHVFIYIGDGRMVDSHGPADKVGKAYGNWPVDGRYAKRIKMIKRAP
jgi:hypothetical protein